MKTNLLLNIKSNFHHYSLTKFKLFTDLYIDFYIFLSQTDNVFPKDILINVRISLQLQFYLYLCVLPRKLNLKNPLLIFI